MQRFIKNVSKLFRCRLFVFQFHCGLCTFHNKSEQIYSFLQSRLKGKISTYLQEFYYHQPAALLHTYNLHHQLLEYFTKSTPHPGSTPITIQKTTSFEWKAISTQQLYLL